MADKATIDAVGAAAEPKNSGSGADQSKLWSIPGSFVFGNTRVSVDKILINDNVFTPIHGIPLKKGYNLKFFGSNLGFYDRAGLLTESQGGNLKTIFTDSGGNNSVLSFTIPDLDGQVKDGGRLWLRLISNRLPQASRVIAPYLTYSAAREEQDKDGKKKGSKGGEAGEAEKFAKGPGPAAVAVEAMGEVIGGIVKPFGASASAVEKSAPEAQAGSAGSQNQAKKDQAQSLDDYDAEAEEAQQFGQESTAVTGERVASGTQEVSTGARVISEGSTANVGAVSQTLTAAARTTAADLRAASGGTAVSQSVSRQVSSGGTQASATTQGGVVSEGSTAVSGGGGTREIRQEVSAQGTQASTGLGGTIGEKIGGTVSETAKLNVKEKISGTVQTSSAASAQAEIAAQAAVSGTARVSAPFGGQAGGASKVEASGVATGAVPAGAAPVGASADVVAGGGGAAGGAGGEANLAGQGKGSVATQANAQAGAGASSQSAQGAPAASALPGAQASAPTAAGSTSEISTGARASVGVTPSAAPGADGGTASSVVPGTSPAAPSGGETDAGISQTPAQIAPEEPQKPLGEEAKISEALGQEPSAGAEAPPGAGEILANLKKNDEALRLGQKLGGLTPGPEGPEPKQKDQQAGKPGGLPGPLGKTSGLGGGGAPSTVDGISPAAEKATPDKEAETPQGPEIGKPLQSSGETAGDESAQAPQNPEQQAGDQGQAKNPEEDQEPEQAPSSPEQGSPGSEPVPRGGSSGRTLDKVKQMLGGQGLAGQASAKIWWSGFGTASGVLFSGLDFFLGALIMNVYWLFGHRKNKNLFPLKKWQKVATVAAIILPFVWAAAGLLLIAVVGCNWPVSGKSKLIGYRGSVIGALYPNVCEALDVSNLSFGSNFSGGGFGGGGSSGDFGNGTCQPVAAGPATVENLSKTCFDGNATQASSIANVESAGGQPTISSGVDKCQPGGESVSWGLFQINLTNHSVAGLPCKDAFGYPPEATAHEYNAKNHLCYIKDPKIYRDCVAAAITPANNIETACQISKNGQRWGQWGANRICGFPN